MKADNSRKKNGASGLSIPSRVVGGLMIYCSLALAFIVPNLNGFLISGIYFLAGAMCIYNTVGCCADEKGQEAMIFSSILMMLPLIIYGALVAINPSMLLLLK